MSYPGQFMIKTYLKGSLITARDGGGHNTDALVTSATTVGPNEKFQLGAVQPSFITLTTSGGDLVTAVDAGGITDAATAFDTTVVFYPTSRCSGSSDQSETGRT